jgi:lysophospholipase L1-like esterase
MGHVVLLGDSIFDNVRYVPGHPAVIEQLQRSLPRGWSATLLAVDGDVTAGIPRQLQRLPADATHLVVSVGGNDALMESGVLTRPARSVRDAFELVHQLRLRFIEAYRAMLKSLLAVNKPTAVCTVYDHIPGLGDAEQAALAEFNEIILREAFAAKIPLIDLRLVCLDEADYSELSPIEPSHLGGAKISRVIAEMLAEHDFGRRRSVVYT